MFKKMATIGIFSISLLILLTGCSFFNKSNTNIELTTESEFKETPIKIEQDIKLIKLDLKYSDENISLTPKIEYQYINNSDKIINSLRYTYRYNKTDGTTDTVFIFTTEPLLPNKISKINNVYIDNVNINNPGFKLIGALIDFDYPNGKNGYVFYDKENLTYDFN